MAERYTTTQQQRLIELNGNKDLLGLEFEDKTARDESFRRTETRLVRENKEKLASLLHEKKTTPCH